MAGNWIIIQARMSSTRLPGKVLLPLGGLTSLEYVVRRCQNVPSAAGVMVATTIHSEDDAIEVWCDSRNVRCVRGSKDDVLSRYLLAAKTVDPEYIIRVTSDCPFISYELLETGLLLAADKKPDVVRWRMTSPVSRGILPEIIKASVLRDSEEIAQLERFREHVTLYIWEQLQNYAVEDVYLPSELLLGEYRITLDEPDDYRLLCTIADYFKGNLDVPTAEVIRYLKEHPQIALMNAHVQQKMP